MFWVQFSCSFELEPRSLGKRVSREWKMTGCPKFQDHMNDTAYRYNTSYQESSEKHSPWVLWEFTELICDRGFQKTICNSTKAKHQTSNEMNDSQFHILLIDGENEIKAIYLIIFHCIFDLTKNNVKERIWPWRGGEHGSESMQLKFIQRFVSLKMTVLFLLILIITFCASRKPWFKQALGLTLTQLTTPPCTRLKLKQHFPTETKSILMNLYLNQYH